MKTIKGNAKAQAPIVLDERGIVIIDDPELLALVAGAASAPAPGGGASSPGGSNAMCGSNGMCGGNVGCPGGGGNALCRPIKQ